MGPDNIRETRALPITLSTFEQIVIRRRALCAWSIAAAGSALITLRLCQGITPITRRALFAIESRGVIYAFATFSGYAIRVFYYINLKLRKIIIRDRDFSPSPSYSETDSIRFQISVDESGLGIVGSHRVCLNFVFPANFSRCQKLVFCCF